MRQVGENPGSSTRTPGLHPENAWNGEPRVIYSNVIPRVEHLKRSRKLIPYSYRPKSGSDGGGGGSEASTVQDDGSAPSSERRRRSSDSRSREKRGRQEGAREDDRRFVDVMLDWQGYDVPLSPIPDISVIDASGRERRVSFRHQELEPVKVGSVVVVREARSGAGVAAYLVGHEMHQIFIVGDGVACSPSLLTQELHALEYGDQEGVFDERGSKSRLEGVTFTGTSSGGAGGGGGKAQDRGHGYGHGESHRRDETAEESRARAQGLQRKALRRLLGSGGAQGGPPHEIFLQAADMGDPESFFYLALLHSAGLHAGEPKGGRAQAQTWALCGANAFNTNANLMLAYRFHMGVGQDRMCVEAVDFYQQAVYELREGREDASQDLYPPPDAYRLGGEHGLGGWGVDAGEGIALAGGAGAAGGAGTGGGGGGGIGGNDGIGGRFQGVGGGMDLDAGPRDVDMGDDVLLRAESGDPAAIMMLGYLYLVGSERMAITVNYAKAEELMWKAVRNGEPAAYSYLGWMHHNGLIGGHLPPELQHSLPPEGDGDGRSSAPKKKGWAGPTTEDEMRQMALNIWGDERLAKTSWGKGSVSKEGTEERSSGRSGGGGWGWSWGEQEEEAEGFLLKEGEDIWGGEESPEMRDWELIGGGVSGAIAAADLYVKGFRAGDPVCGTALADMWLHLEYTDSRDGRGAGGKWSMIQAYLLYKKALDMGKRYGEPQTIAALRLGSMFEHGLVPYIGVNTTKALEYYQESVDNGGMDALLALAELNFFGRGGAVNSSCEAGARFYKMYTDFCVKDTALAAGRVAFERKRYQEAFLNYLIAAELGNKEGQASLAWLLEKGMPSSDTRPPIYRAALEAMASLLPGVVDLLDLDSGGRGRPEEEEAEAGTGDGWRSGLEGVIDNVRGMGGAPREMVSYYRRAAAEQGDADARCEIADDFYRRAKAMGAVPAGTGWLPWVRGRNSHDLTEAGVMRGGGDPSSTNGDGDERDEVVHLAREGDAMRLLGEAVEHYNLSCQTEGGGSPRGLFSMGWLHQHGVGVNLDRGLARDYYRRSASSPAVLGLWLMTASDLTAEIGAPLALSVLLVGITALAMKLLKGNQRWRRRERPGSDDGARDGVGDGSVDGNFREGGGDGVSAPPREGEVSSEDSR